MLPKQTKMLLLIIALPLTACNHTISEQDAARNKLGQSHILFNEDTFIQNVIKGNNSEVELFLKAGIDPNVRFRGDEITVGNLILGRGDTALILATGLNHTDIVRILLDYNANVNERGLSGRTALMLAR